MNTVNPDQARLLRTLVRQDYRKAIRNEKQLMRKVGADYDPSRIAERLQFLSDCHRALGGRELTRENIVNAEEREHNG